MNVAVVLRFSWYTQGVSDPSEWDGTPLSDLVRRYPPQISGPTITPSKVPEWETRR